MSDADKTLDPQAARLVAKVRRLMMIASLTTFVAIAVVIGIIGYRIFSNDGRLQPPQNISIAVPAGAKVLSSAVGEGRIVLTIEVNGAIELVTFDLNTLKPLARIRLSP
jgi:hypothetical protein